MEDILTQTELCEWLKITPVTAYRWRKEGMPYIGKGKGLRYEKNKVLEWLEQRKKT